MAQVIVIFKIYPKDGEFDKAMQSVKDTNPKGMQSEDIGFGIKLIKAMFTFDDAQNSSSKIEEQLKKLDGVGEVEVGEETLM